MYGVHNLKYCLFPVYFDNLSQALLNVFVFCYVPSCYYHSFHDVSLGRWLLGDGLRANRPHIEPVTIATIEDDSFVLERCTNTLPQSCTPLTTTNPALIQHY